MILEGIKIDWKIGYEYVSIDSNSLNPGGKITETIEVWKGGQAVHYNVTSKISISDNDNYLIELSHDHSNNKHINKDETYWGKAIIHFNPNKKSGQAFWEGSDTREYDGETHWDSVCVELFKEIKRKTTNQIQRQNALLRNALLSLDGKCALSGESLPAVLDAAHIIPSSEGGAEVLQNAILLRADLHRLYDSNQFKINSEGCVSSISEAASSYLGFIKNKQLDPKLKARIEKALKIKANIDDEGKSVVDFGERR